ncbi:hypothetical protein Slin14017_G110570 [Septoria linicola]|nr:hypothetical protein Slin14017_G110570 [Septoria linicola]
MGGVVQWDIQDFAGNTLEIFDSGSLKPTVQIRNDGEPIGAPTAANPCEPARFNGKEAVSQWLREQQGSKHSAQWDESFPLDNVRDVRDVSHFEALAREGKAGAPEAMLLLARSQMKLEAESLSGRKRLAAKVKASRILAWVMQTDRRYWDVILPRDFINVLTWHLEAEERSDIALRWISESCANADWRAGAVKSYNPHHRDGNVRWPARML